MQNHVSPFRCYVRPNKVNIPCTASGVAYKKEKYVKIIREEAVGMREPMLINKAEYCEKQNTFRKLGPGTTV